MDISNEAILSALEASGGNKAAAARALGIAASTLKDRLNKFTGEGYTPPEGFAVQRFTMDGEGNVLRRYVEREKKRTAQLITHLEERFAALPALPEIRAPSMSYRDMLTVYPVTDAHIGQLSWGREVGQDYDVEIAMDCLLEGVSGLLKSTPQSEEATLLILGDFQHTNDDTNETQRSRHKLDVDGRFHKVALSSAEIAELMVALLLQHHKKVNAVVLPGNHDPTAYLVVLAALRARFRGNARVTVHERPGPHYFAKFGRNVIGATHGHTVKMDRMPDLLLTECREWVSECPFMYFYSGHIHQRKSFERSGVWCRSFSPATERDAYAYGGGFYSSRGLSSVTHHKDRGMVMESYHPFLPGALCT